MPRVGAQKCLADSYLVGNWNVFQPELEPLDLVGSPSSSLIIGLLAGGAVIPLLFTPLTCLKHHSITHGETNRCELSADACDARPGIDMYNLQLGLDVAAI